MSAQGFRLYDPTAEPCVVTGVIVVVGAGKHSCGQPTFGDGTHFTRRTIARRDGAPLRRVAEARR